MRRQSSFALSHCCALRVCAQTPSRGCLLRSLFVRALSYRQCQEACFHELVLKKHGASKHLKVSGAHNPKALPSASSLAVGISIRWLPPNEEVEAALAGAAPTMRSTEVTPACG